MKVSGQHQALATLHPWGERAPVPTEREAGWVPEPVLMVLEMRKSLGPTKICTSDVQPIASHYTDYAIPPSP